MPLCLFNQVSIIAIGKILSINMTPPPPPPLHSLRGKTHAVICIKIKRWHKGSYFVVTLIYKDFQKLNYLNPMGMTKKTSNVLDWQWYGICRKTVSFFNFDTVSLGMMLDFITSVTFMPTSLSKVSPYILVAYIILFVPIYQIEWVSVVFDKSQTKLLLLLTLIVDEQIQF